MSERVAVMSVMVDKVRSMQELDINLAVDLLSREIQITFRLQGPIIVQTLPLERSLSAKG